MEERPIISVVICTYNQEDYIEQAIQSALAQISNQNYEILIGDDCSTDKTVSIIESFQTKYPEKISIYRSPKNEGATRNLIRLISVSKGDYIAILDGDDLWSDPYKLQKQWEMVSNNSSIGMVCSYASTWDQAQSKITGLLGSVEVESFEKLILSDSDVAAPTLFIKKELLEQCIAESQWYIMNGYFFDTIISFWFSFYSKICFIPEALAVYRVLPNSSCHSTSAQISQSYRKRYFSIKLRFLLENPVPHDLAYSVLMEEWEKILKYSYWIAEKKVKSGRVYKFGAFLLKPIRLFLKK